MIFEKEIYKKKSFYKDLFARFFNVKESVNIPGYSKNLFLPYAVGEISDLKELTQSCSYDAISEKNLTPFLNLQKCTLCLDCLKIEGIEMREAVIKDYQIISMKIKDQNLSSDSDS